LLSDSNARRLARSAALFSWVLALAAAAGCSGGNGTVRVHAAPGCPGVSAQTDTGSHDNQPLAPNGRGVSASGGYAAGSTSELLSGADGVAVLRVVSRGAPTAAADTGMDNAKGAARKPLPHQPAPATGSNFIVLRPARFVVVRNLKGAVVSGCLDLEVPGGSTGSLEVDSSEFPPQFAPGDQMLALFETHDDHGQPTAPYATELFRADRDGSLTLPFGGHEQVNLNTWNPTIGPPPTTGIGSSPNGSPSPPPSGPPPTRPH
jgi:hypothetical protein